MEKKSYIIVDEFNRWLSTGYDMTEKEIEDDIAEVRERLESEGESDVELILFEIKGKPITL